LLACVWLSRRRSPQLTQESSTRAGGYTNNFSYDSAGNATSFKGTSHSFNSNNQDTGNSYDGNGNPTTYSGTTCTFDPENRMTAFGSALTATYRGDGLRAKTVTSAGTTYFIYDGEVMLAEMNCSGTLTAVSTWGAGGLATRTTSGGTTFYTFDPQGSVAQRLNGSGSVMTTDVFDAHGNGASTGTTDCYGYCAQGGYYSDSASGLQLLSLRFFDPSRGRFITRDPIGTAGGVNLHGYGLNNPVISLDPSGTSVRIGRDYYNPSVVGDQDTTKGLPHLDGEGNRNWIDNLGRIHGPGGVLGNVGKKDWKNKDLTEFNNWLKKTGKDAIPPDDVKDDRKKGDGWWWNPGCGWTREAFAGEDKSIWWWFFPWWRIFPKPPLPTPQPTGFPGLPPRVFAY
jgi:RHS repeat-associated protein